MIWGNYWIRFQADYDLEDAWNRLGERLKQKVRGRAAYRSLSENREPTAEKRILARHVINKGSDAFSPLSLLSFYA